MADQTSPTAPRPSESGGETATARPNRHNGWLLGAGALMLLLGILALVASFVATLTTVLLFGVLLLVAGVAQLVHAFRSRSEERLWDIFSGAFYTAAGLLLTIDPVGGAIGLTLLVASLFLVVGALRLSTGLRRRRIGRGGTVHSLVGALDLLLGVLVLIGWPGTSTWFIGLFVGIELILGGLALMTAAAEVPEGRRAWTTPALGRQ